MIWHKNKIDTSKVDSWLKKLKYQVIVKKKTQHFASKNKNQTKTFTKTPSNWKNQILIRYRI